jgi:hypothetical protein
MKRKGQLESVDVVLSLVLLMVALGYAYRVAEANYYAFKQDEILAELRVFGSSAAELLVTSEATTCKCTVLPGTGNDFYITNCIDTQKLLSIANLAQALHLSDRFGVHVRIVNAGIEAGDPLPADNRQMYSERRVVIAHSGDITKSELERCMNGTLTTCERDIAMIYVWRRDLID